jgi:UDP-glucuronate 4-epimerase
VIYVVTGSAGFIGSSLVDRLLSRNRRVVGIDCFRDSYPVGIKRSNIAAAMRNPLYRHLDTDLSVDRLDELDEALGPSADFVVCHLAGRAGVRDSWGGSFDGYIADNIRATASLLEWAASKPGLRNFVFASSSSVYGDAIRLPLREEESIPRPHSPYGVTKLAAENLVRLFSFNRGLPAVCLRFFSVYGPRQRPDMAVHRFIHAALTGKPVQIFGDGSQTRDFTHVDDIVTGVLKSMDATAGSVYNLGGGSRVSISDLLGLVAGAVGAPVPVTLSDRSPGDVSDTQADISLADHDLCWSPSVSLAEGIETEVRWVRGIYGL